MKKCLPTLLTSLIWTALYSPQTFADLAQQCQMGIPTYDQPIVTGSNDTLPVQIDADKSSVNYPDNALFDGNVKVTQGNKTLFADQLTLTQQQNTENPNSDPIRTVTANGNVRYGDELVNLEGSEAWSNLNTKDTDVYHGKYQMVGRQGRGQADKMGIREDSRYTILENGTFTSCLPGDNSWSVVGSEVIQDREEQVAEIWNARFKIGPVPIFYSPYVQLPIGDKRRSGLLIPAFKYSTQNAFEFMLPYYWNIAPNYDATITPHYISRRGLQWQTEFRYLEKPGAGLIGLDVLPNDDLYQRDNPDSKAKRWLFFWGHSGVMNNFWRFNIDYTKVSDYRYLNDLQSTHGSSTDGYASQKFSLGYANQNWNATLASKQFQVFALGGNQNSYHAGPQFDLNYYKNDLGPLDFHLFGQVVKFTSESQQNPISTRWHLEPTLNWPLSNKWGSINSEAKLLATHYQQDIPDNYIGMPLADHVNRVLPEVKVDGKMVFERQMQLLSNSTQTLEPRMQYLYIPLKDQSQIATYDTTILQTDYIGLFRDRPFSGLDRIASANQITTGVTSRVYDQSLDERFNVSVGQIYYFSRSRTSQDRVKPNDSLDVKIDSAGSLAWAADSYWKINKIWGLRGGLQYDTRINRLTLANSVLEYRDGTERTVQLNYRYASPDYITVMLPNYNQFGNYALYKEGISQAGIVASMPLASRWSVVGSHYYDTKRKQAIDSKVGLQYSTCCWAIRVDYERKINDWNSLTQASLYDNKVSFNIELRGLSNNYGLGTHQMLRSGIIPYQQAF